MKTTLRRFVNLVADDCARNAYTLRRIDMSRFFLPAAATTGMGDPLPLEDRCLPEPCISFYSPQRDDDQSGDMDFMLLREDKVIATDGTFMYDPDMHAVRSVPSPAQRNNWPVSVPVPVGDKLYVLDRAPSGPGRSRAFQALVSTASSSSSPASHHWSQGRGGRLQWRALPPPPPHPCAGVDPTWIDSCAVVAGGYSIWVSTTRGGGGDERTYSFDTERLVWASEPAGWALPFCGLAAYVPELRSLWFGIASRDHGRVFCASDLAAASVSLHDGSRPPVLHAAWDDMAGAAPRSGVSSRPTPCT